MESRREEAVDAVDHGVNGKLLPRFGGLINPHPHLWNSLAGEVWKGVVSGHVIVEIR